MVLRNRFKDLSLVLTLFMFGNTSALAAPYCYSQYVKNGLAYKRLRDPGSQWGVINIKRVSDIYPSKAKARQYIETSEGNLGELTDIELSIEVSVADKSVQCTVDSKSGKAICDGLILMTSTGRSSYDVPARWNQGLQFARATLNNQEYYVINGVHPIDESLGGGPDHKDPSQFGGPLITINPAHPIYNAKCVNPFDPSPGTYKTQGYQQHNRSSNAFVCVQKSICTEKGARTHIIESSYLVPIKYDGGFMRTAAIAFSSNMYYPEYMTAKQNVESFMRKSDVLPVTIHYSVLGQIELPSYGF